MHSTNPTRPTSLTFDARELGAARRANRILSFAPRLRFDSALGIHAGRAIIRALEPFAAAQARRGGVAFREREVSVQDSRVRIREARPAGRPRAVVLDIHGGGWTMGRPHMDDSLNAERVRAGLAVVSPDYRLLPENAIEDCLTDCETAARWLLMTADYAGCPILIAGESAGAHLAMSTLLRLKAKGFDIGRIVGAVLFYGVYDLGGTPSMRAAGAGTLVLHGPGMQRAAAHLVPHMDEAARRGPDLSPLYGELAGLPDALLVVGTRDPLIDDSRLLAQRWRAAGGCAELVVVPEAPHGFNRLPTRMARKTNAYATAWMRERTP